MLVDGLDDDSDSAVVSYLVVNGPRYRAELSHHCSRRRFWYSTATTLPQLGPVRKTVETDRRARCEGQAGGENRLVCPGEVCQGWKEVD